MLYWQRKPDPILTAIVDEALAACLDHAVGFEADDAGAFTAAYPRAGELFGLPQWRSEIEKLKGANLAPRVYGPPEYHWLIIYEALEEFCELYNDSSLGAIVHEGTTILEIDFDALVEVFFWDLDFTVPLRELSGLGLQGRERMGFAPETIGIAAGLAPHPEELVLREEAETIWSEAGPTEDYPLFRRGCETYPARGE